MTQSPPLEIYTVDPEDRDSLSHVLEESFEGVYLRHSKRTLRESELVRAARLEGRSVGLVMLKELGHGVGYIYYIAVVRSFRGRGIAGKLLDDALVHFQKEGLKEVYASVEVDNSDSIKLFSSRGFILTKFSEVSAKYGKVSAAMLYGKMWVVPGERVFVKNFQAQASA